MPRFLPLVSALCLTLFLAGCETAEERAEGHYQSGLALLAEGDVERALVEFRNVFQLDGQHREARTTYARTVREQGKLSEAFGQYKRLVEQYPDDIDGRRALGEMAVAARNWEEAERHVEAGLRLAPQDPMLKALKATLDYRQAVMDEDRDARAEALDRSTALLAADASNQFARAIVIDGQLISRDFGLALDELNRGLELDPTRMDFHDLKLRTLAQLERTDEVGAHLRSMIAEFPENQRIRGALINWYLRQGQLDEAEGFLRELAEAAPEEAKDGAKTTVVQFLQRTKGVEAAKAEVERLIAEGSNPPLFRSMRAAMMFDEGLRDGAIVELQDVLNGAPDNEQIRGIKIALARMLQVTGDAVGARALVEEVLVSDEANVPALKMKATWLIEEDKAGESITILRSALDQNPRDAETLTIMARAHLRDGSRQLAGERLALAVEVSEKGAAESLRYAQFLVEDERLPVAESVLVDALKLAPENLDLLNALGQIYLRQGDWPRTEGIVTRLQELGRVPEGGTAAPETRRAEALARGLRATLLLRQEKTNESIEYLQGIIKQGDGSISAIAGVLSTYLTKGQTDEARAFLDEELAKDTESLPLRFMDAQLDAASDQTDQAEEKLLKLMEDSPESPAVVQALFTLYFRTGRIEDADAVLEKGLANTNRVPALLFLKANRLERQGDIEGTIALYEELYAGDTNNVVLANNLASMLVTHRNDQASLDRAYAVARRLRGATVPPLQDTYGWIEYRRGNYEVALEYLKPAAAGLPRDALVQYHLGMTYLKLGQIETGRAQLLQALKIAGRSELPQFDDARRTLEALPEPAPETEGEGTETEETTGSD